MRVSRHAGAVVWGSASTPVAAAREAIQDLLRRGTLVWREVEMPEQACGGARAMQA